MTNTHQRQVHTLSQWTEVFAMAPWVAQQRIARFMFDAFANRPVNQREASRMGQEKVDAMAETWVGMATAGIDLQFRLGMLVAQTWWSPKASTQRATNNLVRSAQLVGERAVQPTHRRVTRNFRRLSKHQPGTKAR